MQKPAIREGMKVHAPDGRVLGKVTAVGDAHFEVEPGLVSMKDYRVAFSHVAFIREGHLELAHGWDDLERVVENDGSAVPPRHSEHMDDEQMIHAAGPEASHP